MRNMIAMECYLNGMYNEEYIPGELAYQTQYYPHDFILIGFNDIAIPMRSSMC